MAAITWANVSAIAPAVALVSVDAQTIILAHVNTTLSAAAWGGEESPKLLLARVYLAAHYAMLIGNDGDMIGPVSSESTGGVSRSYAVIASNDGGIWSSTSFGQQYYALLRTTVARLPLVP